MGTRLNLSQINIEMYKKEKGKEKEVFLPKKKRNESEINKILKDKRSGCERG